MNHDTIRDTTRNTTRDATNEVSHDITRDEIYDVTPDRKMKESESYEGANPQLKDIPLPITDNVLYSILNSLNHNIANFYAYTKFKDYISENTLETELLQRSMSIHRDFLALFLHTKEELVFIHPELLERAEKLLFKGKTDTNLVNYTRKICRVINDYKMTLHREGYLPDLKMQLLLADI